jgi:DNA-binding transcriptional LysR family regulator
VRRTKPLRLSAAGMKLLRLAEDVLPRIDALEDEFRALVAGKSGRLHIAIECHACFEWLFPVLEKFRHAWPDVDVDIRPGLAFGALPALVREEVDLVVSSDPEDLPASPSRPSSTTSRASSPPRPPAGRQALRRGRGFPRRDADHLPGRPRPARCLHRAADARQGSNPARSGRWS